MSFTEISLSCKILCFHQKECLALFFCHLQIAKSYFYTRNPSTLTHHHRVLSKAPNDAIDLEFTEKNVVAKEAKPPKPIERWCAF